MSKFKKFAKIFLLVILILVVLFYGIGYAMLNSISVKGGADGYPAPDDRINVLVIGVARGLSDTIMLCSLDTKENTMSVYSIPRDTYYHRKGHSGGQDKINSTYGAGGVDFVAKSVQDLTKVPINYYVEVDYEAVKAIVNAIGGIPVTVPQDMDYDDPTDNLHIHFKEGQVVSSGEDIIRLIRYRKNSNGGGYREGDLGRIKMQQQVVSLGIKKLLNWNLVGNFVKLQKPVKENIKTNMTPKQMVAFAMKANKAKKNGITFETLPGAAKTMENLSFFVVNEKKMNEMLKDLQETK